MSGLPGAASPGSADGLLVPVPADPEPPARGGGARQHRDDKLCACSLALAVKLAAEALERRPAGGPDVRMIWKVLLIAMLVAIVLALLVAILATLTLDMAVNPHGRDLVEAALKRLEGGR